jgi:hypothetical protein
MGVHRTVDYFYYGECMKNWNDYLDSNGLVVQKGGDGGDSLNRTCSYIFLTMITHPNVLQIMDAQRANAVVYRHLEVSPGRYRRSPHQGMWYSHGDRTSRDQLIPLVIMLGIASRSKLGAVFRDHLKRGLLFAYNTHRNFQYPTLEEHLAKSTPDVKWNYGWKLPDLTGPEFWVLYIRGFRSKVLYPLLYLFDLETVISSILIRFQTDKDDVLNHALILEFARVRMDTLWTKLARLITPRTLLQMRLNTFFGKEQEPPINELYAALPD